MALARRPDGRLDFRWRFVDHFGYGRRRRVRSVASVGGFTGRAAGVLCGEAAWRWVVRDDGSLGIAWLRRRRVVLIGWKSSVFATS